MYWINLNKKFIRILDEYAADLMRTAKNDIDDKIGVMSLFEYIDFDIVTDEEGNIIEFNVVVLEQRLNYLSDNVWDQRRKCHQEHTHARRFAEKLKDYIERTNAKGGTR